MTTEYPTLSDVASAKIFGHAPLVNPVHRVDTPSGRIITRPLDSGADIPVVYTITYEGMSNTDKEILEDWERDDIRYGAVEFEWDQPKTDTTYKTKLLAPIKYRTNAKGSGVVADLLWSISFTIAALKEA